MKNDQFTEDEKKALPEAARLASEAPDAESPWVQLDLYFQKQRQNEAESGLLR